MPRAYTIATIGVALGVDSKWVDNVVSHFAVSGVVSARQGISRKISVTGVLELSLIHRLDEIRVKPRGGRAKYPGKQQM